MGLFSKPKIRKVSTPDDEKESAAVKARLLETEGENQGAELNAAKGQSIRRVFG